METKQLRLIGAFKDYVSDLFNLHEDKERETTTINDIKKGVEFRGANLWILIFAILIASIGLNVNSTAVIIGAMLISPLMGPIMGIGLGAGINDFPLIKKAFRNLSVAVLISVLTSAIYFAITPLHEAQSELLARTNPTLWDVLIAFFGGLAGIVAGSRKEKSNAIPGVAIATALMPPLCTAGYGLANGNWYYFFGAFYLFFINSVFISTSTFLIVRFLKYPKKKFEDAATEKKMKSYVVAFVFLTLVPSVWLAYHVVRRTYFEQNARNFVNTEFNMDDTQVIGQSYSLEDQLGVIEVTLYGKAIDQREINELESRLAFYNLDNVELRIRQGYQEDINENARLEFEKMSQDLRLGVLEDLYAKNEEALKSKDSQIAFLEQELHKYTQVKYPINEISAELRVQYASLKSLSMGDLITQNRDTVCHAFATFTRRPARADRLKIEEWLKLRSKADSLVVVIQ